MPTRGHLIVFEGLDRSGKSTQCAHLVARLNATHRTTHLFKFPDRTTRIGSLINDYLTSSPSSSSSTTLSDHVIHLLFSANRWELVPRIKAVLERGENVVLDRYLYSGTVYSLSAGLPLSWCRAPDVGLPEPDLLLFMDLSEEVAKERGGFGEERYESIERQRKVRQGFEVVMRDCEGVKSVDAGRSIGEVEEEIWRIVEAELEIERGELKIVR